MKKAFLILAALAMLVGPVLAEDASVLPAGVLRTTFAYINSASDQAFDEDGEKVDSMESKINALGVAFEYGVTDQITAAIQWTPAWIFSSELEVSDKAHVNGLGDLFVGAKILIVGSNGFVPNEQFRFSFAPGMIIPLDNPDWDEEFENMMAGDDFKAGSLSKQTFAFGFRAYFDWILSEMFFVNLYNESIFYLPVEKEVLTPFGVSPELEFKYGPQFTFELEPNFRYPISEAVRLSAGLPFTLVMNGESEVEGTKQDDAGHVLSVNPSISAFIMTVIPLELKASYSLPLLGKSAGAGNTFALQLKTFVKF